MSKSKQQSRNNFPIVALTLGDPAGIGPELCARLLAEPDVTAAAHIVLVGDPWLWEEGQRVANQKLSLRTADSIAQAAAMDFSGGPVFVPMHTVTPDQVTYSEAHASGGQSVLEVLDVAVDHARIGVIDAICFAPLNKNAMKQGGLKFEDELHHFADRLGVTDYFCELNVLDRLWTSRITSHVALRDVPPLITRERVKAAGRLLYRTLLSAGFEQPRVVLAAINPHGGDGGNFGREEIDILEPAACALNEEGVPVSGPLPADTIFIKARDGDYDAVVTMYHDQGQIALKLMGFDRGVTVQGGLPIPITTPAHGTAYDIAGKGQANIGATKAAFLLAARMGSSGRDSDQRKVQEVK